VSSCTFCRKRRICVQPGAVDCDEKPRDFDTNCKAGPEEVEEVATERKKHED